MSYRMMKLPACLVEPMIEHGVHVMTDAIEGVRDPKILEVKSEWKPGDSCATIIVLVQSPDFHGDEGDPSRPLAFRIADGWGIAEQYEEFNPSFRSVARRERTGAERSGE